ncbi:MAG: hypothetical protein IKB86_03295 [Clostridia bacterium]|nr:hypothetical protein [Clostridia bacterium]MBR6633305.1 hypothetical protein [Clostridia bacterium]
MNDIEMLAYQAEKVHRRIKRIENSSALQKISLLEAEQVNYQEEKHLTKRIYSYKDRQGVIVFCSATSPGENEIEISVGDQNRIFSLLGEGSFFFCGEMKKGYNTVTVAVRAKGSVVASVQAVLQTVDLG